MNIREARILKKMTQEELAEAVGVAPAMISRYESGRVFPPVEKIQRISSVVGVPVEDLLSEKDIAPNPTGMEINKMIKQIGDILQNHFHGIQLPLIRSPYHGRPPYDFECITDKKTWFLEIAPCSEKTVNKMFPQKFFSVIGQGIFYQNINKLSIVTPVSPERVIERVPFSLRNTSVGFDVSILHVNLESGRIDYELELLTHYDGKGFFDLAVPGKEVESARMLAAWKTSLTATT